MPAETTAWLRLLLQRYRKAWTNYDSGATVRDSFNTSSVTDHDTGEHSVSLTNNMGNDDYAYSGGAKDGFNGNYGRIVSNTQTATSSHRQITVLCNDNSRDDYDEVGTSVHRDRMSKAAELAALIGSQTALSNRNLIINGSMQVSQRGTSSTGITSSGYRSAPDRFRPSIGSAGTWTIADLQMLQKGFQIHLA